MGHALVQRIALESLGVVEVDVKTQVVAPVLDPKPTLDMAPGFADDGCLAGPSQEVLRSVQQLKALLPRFGIVFFTLGGGPFSRPPQQRQHLLVYCSGLHCKYAGISFDHEVTRRHQRFL